MIPWCSHTTGSRWKRKRKDTQIGMVGRDSATLYLKGLVSGDKEGKAWRFNVTRSRRSSGSGVVCEICAINIIEKWDGVRRAKSFWCSTCSQQNFESVENTLSCISVRWSSSDKIDHSVCAKKIQHLVVKGRDKHTLESLPSTIESAHLVRYNQGVYPFTTERAWHHHGSMWIDSTATAHFRLISKPVVVMNRMKRRRGSIGRTRIGSRKGG